VQTCFIDDILRLLLVQVLDEVLAVNHCQHSIQLAGVLEVLVNKERLQGNTEQHWELLAALAGGTEGLRVSRRADRHP
jgi:hypothetical protein